MCFSARADVVVGLAVGVIGVDTLRRVRHRRELPLAALPLLFGLHQLVEAFVWWGLDGQVAWSIGRGALWIYLVFAWGVLPPLVPAAVIAIEPEARRRHVIAPFVVLGAIVGASLLTTVLQGPIGASIGNYHLVYHTSLNYPGAFSSLYILAVCAPLLLSSYRHLVAFGIANLGAVLTLTWLTAAGSASLWCAWAAVTSIVVAAHLRYADRPEAGAPRIVGA